ncbi:MAG: D-aminoacylase [Acidobacteriota bacterium]
MFDVLIRNGLVLDGTGRPAFRADVGLLGKRIDSVGKLEGATAARVIDAQNLVIAPGFIDIHTHADIELIAHPRIESKTMQGVTTEVFSNCGLGFAPVSSEKALSLQRRYLKGLFGDGNGLDWSWKSMREFLDRFRVGIACNMAYLVPHGALRVSAMGWQDRPATSDEIKVMDRLLKEAFESGAWGLTTGLFYRPMNSATSGECVVLSQTVARHEGFLGIHLRDYQVRLMESLDESFQISRESGVRLQVSHLQAPGKLNKGRSMGEQLMQRIETARKEGLDVLCDLYPYTAGCTMLASLLPSWVTAGEVGEAVSFLRDPHYRDRICQHLQELSYLDFSEMFLCGFRAGKNRSLEGLRMTEIARECNQSVPAAICELLASEEMQIAYVLHQCSEEDLRTILEHPTLMIGSDAVHLEGTVHPRVFGTYPRVLAEYVRRQSLFSLEEAIRKMSSMPAERLGLRDRGYVRPGLVADLVLFNPATVQDLATYENPRQYPAGIPYVLVNGTLVKDLDRHTGALPGEVLIR